MHKNYFYYYFFSLCLTKQQFLFVALFRFLLTLNIKKIIIINYNLNRPIKLCKKKKCCYEHDTKRTQNTGVPIEKFEKKT